MTDDIVDLLIVAAVVRHLTFLQFHFRAERTELLNEPHGTLHVCGAVRYTRTERHLTLDIYISAVGAERRTLYNGLLFGASREK